MLQPVNMDWDKRSVSEISRQIQENVQQIDLMVVRYNVNGSLLKSLGYGRLADKLVEIRDDLEEAAQQLSLF